MRGQITLTEIFLESAVPPHFLLCLSTFVLLLRVQGKKRSASEAWESLSFGLNTQNTQMEV